MLMTLTTMPKAQLLGRPPLLERLKGRGGNPTIRPILHGTYNVARRNMVYCSPCGKGWVVT